eukprot:g11599.t1
MWTAMASTLALLAFSREASACVELQGIVADGGEGLLDLLFLLSPEKSLGNDFAPLDIFTNPLVPTVAECSGDLETPMGLRVLTALDTTVFSLGSAFEPNGVALDIFGDKQTSDARRRCQPTDGDEIGLVLFDMHLSVAVLYAVAYVGLTNMPWCADKITAMMEDLGCSISLVDVADGDPEPSTDTPWGLAKAYIDESMGFLMENDGWNADGGLGGKEFNRVPFTGDFFYQDSAGNEWDGYTPENTPYKFKRTKKWQPLLESNGFGYISTQEHVTPHIGITARFFGFNSTADEKAWGLRQLEEPPYMNRHEEVAREVLEASKIAADDLQKQFAISFFDNKFNSLVPLKITYFLRRLDSLSMLDFLNITIKSQLAMYNAVVLAWREKVRHDAPRPSSVIRKEIGAEIVEAYAGPAYGVQNMTASEWEPYIRTMPHSEYPSASACICEAFVSALKLWAESDTIDPPLEFPPPEFGVPILSFSSWSEVSQTCGDSRVWGGMHFEGSVPAGAKLCGGDEPAHSIAASIDALTAGDESAAVFKPDISAHQDTGAPQHRQDEGADASITHVDMEHPVDHQEGGHHGQRRHWRPRPDGWGVHQAANEVHEAAAAASTRAPGIVQLNFMGRLGNNLFECTAARVLADRLGWALSIQPAKENVTWFDLLTRPEGMSCFPGVQPGHGRPGGGQVPRGAAGVGGPGSEVDRDSGLVSGLRDVQVVERSAS